MITREVHGDITAQDNESDIIIAMNSQLGDLSALGRKFITPEKQKTMVSLGTVLTYQYDLNRRIHMIVCHNLCENGWRCAPGFLRFGLDYLWVNGPERNYSIVQVGNGPVGRKFGADVKALRQAMEQSHLELTLFIRQDEEEAPLIEEPPLQLLTAWSPINKELELTH